MSRNISIYVISAICGNWWTESGINSGIYESLIVTPPDFVYQNNRGGFGLGQWTNVYVPQTGRTSWRRLNMHNWLSANNYSADSFEGQIEYLFQEGFWIQKSEYPEFSSLDDFLQSTSTDIERLTHAYNLCWEGIRNATWDTRVAQAQQVYQYLLHHGSDTGLSPVVGNFYTSEAQRLNNAVCVYQYLNGSTPPTPPTPVVLNDYLLAIIKSKRDRKELL